MRTRKEIEEDVVPLAIRFEGVLQYIGPKLSTEKAILEVLLDIRELLQLTKL